MDVRTVLSYSARGRVRPGRCPVCGPTLFQKRGPWLRDDLVCSRCGSIPRQRALATVLDRAFPRWRDSVIHESSPSGPGSAMLRRECPAYTASQYFDGVASGDQVGGVQCQDLRALSFADASIDILVTQDVLEHIVDPATALREIARVLRPGGAHVFTVPVYARPETVVRVADDGTRLLPEEFHGNPVGDGRALVVREWGDDITAYLSATCSGVATARHSPQSRWKGIQGEMTDVFVATRSR